MLPLFNRKNMCIPISDKNYDISIHTLPPPLPGSLHDFNLISHLGQRRVICESQVKCFTTFIVESFETEHQYDAYKLLRFCQNFLLYFTRLLRSLVKHVLTLEEKISYLHVAM